jgi:hypothetical protein
VVAAAPHRLLQFSAASKSELFSSSPTQSLQLFAEMKPQSQMLPAESLHVLPFVCPVVSAAANAASPVPQLTPLLACHLPMPSPHADDDGATSTALVLAFECLKNADKVRDVDALAGLLSNLGVNCAADLAHVDDAATLAIMGLLKQATAHFFAVTLGHPKTVWLANVDPVYTLSASGRRQECFAYLQDATKQIDPAATAAHLRQLGITCSHELQYLDDCQLNSIVQLMKPVAANVFVHMMGYVSRGL